MTNRTGIYETAGFSNKEELVDGVNKRVMKLKEKFTEEEKNTKKYIEYEAFLNKFVNYVENMKLPKNLDPEWSYSFAIGKEGAGISLGKYEFESESKIIIHENYRLKYFETDLLTSFEYAKLHNVSETTVRQWIRRGKIRSAKKYGNNWRIPAFAEPSKGKYCNVFMGWKEKLTDLFDEYEFINNYNEAKIQQIGNNEYLVQISNSKTKDSTVKKMDLKEREKFELMMIANPFVTMYDDPSIVIS